MLNVKIKHLYECQDVMLYCEYDWLMSIQQKSKECPLKLVI
jgi:hypothetical protein